MGGIMRKTTKLRNEELLFLVLCKDEDRKKLLKESKMSLQDFKRLTYITHSMGLESYTNYLYSIFPECLEQLSEQILLEIQIDSNDDSFVDEECYIYYDEWLKDFCHQLPSRQLRNMYREKFNID
jgi:hypothetical protein